ncbi:D-alanyl-D-alanine carboxypeptidase [Abditibacterium utsteinense]|uniref:D-alanyl-D-alanine carboxypeptidase n=1 Tax=Abditibacterium utsteinense TaxID=1960156 RepID=A0A2S8STP0_9BACT|nr:D-alanyl-D-alanine carboxypeptidase/D-alanyl-D-alanine-endopeptidase [Abditibacterium utsteinense]PQV64172.1 D-alanyl-D-alanine carboxypeptidase [Abditibacterium utsteinense]
MKKPLLFALVLGFSAPLFASPAPKTLPATTRAQIEALLRHPDVQTGHIGLAIVALGKAKSPAQFPAAPYDNHAQPLLFERDSQKRFLPASNMKLFTAAWALQQLGPDARFTTRVVQTQFLATRAGAWPANTPYPSAVTLYGDGDPSLSSADLDEMATQIAASPRGAMIVRASDALFPTGNMNAEEGGGRYPDGWTLDDALWYYGAPISALAVNRNQVDVTITGGAVGEAAAVRSEPEAPFSIFAPVITVPKGDPSAGKLSWTRGDNETPLGQTLSITGFVAPGQTDTEGVAVQDPRAWAQSLLGASLRAKGAVVVEPEGFYGQKDAVVIAEHPSPPLASLLQRFLKNSDNLYGEMLLRRTAISLPRALKTKVGQTKVGQTKVGEPIPALPQNPQIASTGVAARAHGAMFSWLKQSGVPTAGLRFSDGSGLSRYDLVTPIAVAKLLGAAEKIRGGAAFYDALPIAGVDGTLKNRMKGSAAEKNVHAKTGSFSVVSTLSGYVTTRDGQRLAVSILTNGIENGDLARRWQNRVFAALAGADFGKK